MTYITVPQYVAKFGEREATDITPLEEWDAANASGASLPATINSANNGTITGGSVVTL